MPLRLPIGTSDFAKIRRDGNYYVDKTAMIADVVRGSAAVVLLPRPRRFGKTVNLSMLRYWFECSGDGTRTPEEVRGYFAGLEVATAGEDVEAHFQRHPVIFLTFKDVKHRKWESCQEDVRSLIREEVLRHRHAWTHPNLSDFQRQALEALAEGRGSATDLGVSLRVLSQALHAATGEECVLLIDEYDTPIHQGWEHGYYDDVIELFRNLLSGAFKDNSSLYRGVLTGILRVAKESMFSGLNNLAVYSLLAPEYATRFGFTTAEVEAMCALAGPSANMDGIREWYNGYLMGGGVVYNPWSVLRYLDSMDKVFRPYWVNTGSDDLIRDLVIRSGLGVHAEVAELIRGGEIVRPVSEDIQLRDLRGNAGALWSFLLFSGYLKARDVTQLGGETVATLSVPNREVLASYTGIFRDWMRSAIGGSEDVNRLCRAVLSGDAQTFGAGLQRLVLQSLSFFDTGKRTAEAVYQSFLVGLLVQLNMTHTVDTNGESGFGRYDVCISPRVDYRGSRAGVVMELKSIDDSCEPPETSDTALAAAMKQIKDREYAVMLRAAGADPVWLWAVVFDGKRVRVKVEQG